MAGYTKTQIKPIKTSLISAVENSTGQAIADRVKELLDPEWFTVEQVAGDEWRVYTSGRFKFYCGGIAFNRGFWTRLVPMKGDGSKAVLTCTKNQDLTVRTAIYKAIEEIVHGRKS